MKRKSRSVIVRQSSIPSPPSSPSSFTVRGLPRYVGNGRGRDSSATNGSGAYSRRPAFPPASRTTATTTTTRSSQQVSSTFHLVTGRNNSKFVVKQQVVRTPRAPERTLN